MLWRISFLVTLSLFKFTFSRFSFKNSLPSSPELERAPGELIELANGIAKATCLPKRNVNRRRNKEATAFSKHSLTSWVMRVASPVLLRHQHHHGKAHFHMKKSYKIYYNRNEILIYNVQSNAGSLLTWKSEKKFVGKVCRKSWSSTCAKALFIVKTFGQVQVISPETR